ncbi:MAG: hypothetical protein II537_04660 [Bacteroidales bacterium]|nr:hypothetical protein [Bacteroidales bacterium]
MEIPRGNGRENNKARKQIIKDFYATWIAEHPGKRVWNHALNANICVKFKSINETAGQASASYESTLEVFRLTEILSNAVLIKKTSPKRGDENQKSFSEMLIMRHRSARLIVGRQRTTGEYVQYCISAWGKK